MLAFADGAGVALRTDKQRSQGRPLGFLLAWLNCQSQDGVSNKAEHAALKTEQLVLTHTQSALFGAPLQLNMCAHFWIRSVRLATARETNHWVFHSHSFCVALTYTIGKMSLQCLPSSSCMAMLYGLVLPTMNKLARCLFGSSCIFCMA
jgi:hypothetical protein